MTRSGVTAFPPFHVMQRAFIHDLPTYFKVLVPLAPFFVIFWILKDVDNRVNRWIRSGRRKHQVRYDIRL